MTVGKDVSMLFPHVVNCMQTDDLELKKLVYLYLINYAKTQPDLAIMGVNTFVKVSYCIGLRCLCPVSLQMLLVSAVCQQCATLHSSDKPRVTTHQLNCCRIRKIQIP